MGDDIKIDFTEMGCEGIDCILLASAETSGFMKEELLLYQLNNYQFLRKGSIPYRSLVFTVR
jgi:hypothetical protein